MKTTKRKVLNGMNSLAMAAACGGAVLAGCADIETSEDLGTSDDAIVNCAKPNVAYGEIGQFAVVSVANTNSPSGLADAISSLYAACQRNPIPGACLCKDGSFASAYADQKAWQNINANLNGPDKSNNANYVCVGTQNCAIVNTCRVSGYANGMVSRSYPLPFVAQTPIGTLNAPPGQTGTVYYYRDPKNGNCQVLESVQLCSSIGGPDANYTYTCQNPKSTFAAGEKVWALAKFTELWRNHRFMVKTYKNNVLQWTWPTGYNNIGVGGWRQAFFFPSLSNSTPGSWRFDLYIDYGTGYKLFFQKAFTVNP